MNNIENKVDSFLSFRLGKETFAVSVGKVLEILEVPHITQVPRSPEYMRGVINLRGTVLPVIDARTKFGLSASTFTVNTCIIVLSIEMEGEQTTLGALVDSVQEVMEIEEAQILPSPSIGARFRSEFIRGMVKQNDDFTMLLHIDRVFSLEELAIVQESAVEPVL